jgi:hypothetical protein
MWYYYVLLSARDRVVDAERTDEPRVLMIITSIFPPGMHWVGVQQYLPIYGVCVEKFQTLLQLHVSSRTFSIVSSNPRSCSVQEAGSRKCRGGYNHPTNDKCRVLRTYEYFSLVPVPHLFNS